MSDSPETSIGRRDLLATALGAAIAGPLSAAEGQPQPRVLITGASRGIGLEFAKRYAERGWQVVATCRTPSTATALNELAASRSNIVVERLDVVDHATVDALAARLSGQPIDVLLNNAGIGGGGENQLFGKLRYDVYPEVMKVNAEGPIKVCEAFLAHVAASRQKKMITVSSSQGSIGSVTMPMLYWYRSSKSAVNMIMYNLALQLKNRSIIVGLVTPGATDTDFMVGLPKKMLRPVAEAVTDMMREIDRFDLATTGRFLGYRGDVLPW
ncbi:MAG: SDR family oxidoreductase [Gammaproteobacteria bacterium]|nr:SDR family oxidoreductase [Gammaproteobacteria bacterium]